MANLLFTTKNPLRIAREEYYGPDARSVVFSYANPKLLQEAKLEILKERVETQFKSSLGDRRQTHNYSSPSAPPSQTRSPTSIIAQVPGEANQIRCLVVPPTANRSGHTRQEESTFIVRGQRKDIQIVRQKHVGRRTGEVVPRVSVSSHAGFQGRGKASNSWTPAQKTSAQASLEVKGVKCGTPHNKAPTLEPNVQAMLAPYTHQIPSFVPIKVTEEVSEHAFCYTEEFEIRHKELNDIRDKIDLRKDASGKHDKENQTKPTKDVETPDAEQSGEGAFLDSLLFEDDDVISVEEIDLSPINPESTAGCCDDEKTTHPRNKNENPSGDMATVDAPNDLESREKSGNLAEGVLMGSASLSPPSKLRGLDQKQTSTLKYLKVSQKERKKRQNTSAIPAVTRKTTSGVRRGALAVEAQKAPTLTPAINTPVDSHATVKTTSVHKKMESHDGSAPSDPPVASSSHNSLQQSIRRPQSARDAIFVFGVDHVPLERCQSARPYPCKGASRQSSNCSSTTVRDVRPEKLKRPRSACARLLSSASQRSDRSIWSSSEGNLRGSRKTQRPLSSSRVRPPSAGSWAGRPPSIPISTVS